MKQISVALEAHLAQPYQTMTTCVRVQLVNGTVLRFTALDQNLVVSGWTVDGNGYDITPLNGTYLAYAGYFPSDTQLANSLAVANTEISGPMIAPSILDADVYSGVWDFADVKIFQVNYKDVTMGPLWGPIGRSGEISTVVGIGNFKEEVRGLAQAYTRQIVELTQPLCRADLFDARCKVNPAAYSFTSTVTGVSADNMTFQDTARTEAGPSTGVAITGITNANPGVVTLANTSLNLFDGQPITMSAIVGMPKLNVVTTVHNPSGASFALDIDTTDTAVYGTYASGGLVVPYGGGGAGFFDFGTVLWNTGPNAGLRMEVKSYVPGQLALVLPMPFLISVGNSYTVRAGCDRAFTTCRDKFNNVVNFRGEYKLPGIDKMVQVGRKA